MLVAELIKQARLEISLLSGNLNNSVYGAPEVLGAIEQFCVQDHVNLRTLLDGRVAPGEQQLTGSMIAAHPFIKRATEAGLTPKCLEVPPEVKDKFQFHFLLVDRKAFRFERDWKKMEAVADFKNEKVANSLAQRFEEIWELSSS